MSTMHAEPRVRLWRDEDLTVPAPSALDLAYDCATDDERRRHEDRVSAFIRARAATLKVVDEFNPEESCRAAKDVPAALARMFQMLEEFVGKPGKVPQSVADRWAHEMSVLVVQVRNARSESYEEPGLSQETRLALARASMPEHERQLAKRLLRTLADECE